MSQIVLTAGETMALLDPNEDGSPLAGARYLCRVEEGLSLSAVGGETLPRLHEVAGELGVS